MVRTASTSQNSSTSNPFVKLITPLIGFTLFAGNPVRLTVVEGSITGVALSKEREISLQSGRTLDANANISFGTNNNALNIVLSAVDKNDGLISIRTGYVNVTLKNECNECTVYFTAHSQYNGSPVVLFNFSQKITKSEKLVFPRKSFNDNRGLIESTKLKVLIKFIDSSGYPTERSSNTTLVWK